MNQGMVKVVTILTLTQVAVTSFYLYKKSYSTKENESMSPKYDKYISQYNYTLSCILAVFSIIYFILSIYVYNYLFIDEDTINYCCDHMDNIVKMGMYPQTEYKFQVSEKYRLEYYQKGVGIILTVFIVFFRVTTVLLHTN